MATFQVRNVPDSLHKRLKKQSEKRNCSMREIVLEAVEKELNRAELLKQIYRKPKRQTKEL